MAHPLDELTIRGFKSIASLEKFQLRNLNVLIGGNGSGKSNFVEFFRMLLAMMKTDGLKQYVEGSASAYMYGGPKETPAIEISLIFGQNGYDFDLSPTQKGHFQIINEEGHHFLTSGEVSTRHLGSGNFNPVLLEEKDTPALDGDPYEANGYIYEAIRSWQVYHFHDTSSRSGVRRYTNQSNNESLSSDAANLAAFLLKLKIENVRAYREIITAVQLVIPFLDDFILKPNPQEKLRLEWRQKELDDYPLQPSQLSDGSIRFISLAVALLQPNPPSTIVIDEPELGLHPQAIDILAELIQSAAKRTQVIVATQSPALIDQFALDDIIVVSRHNGRSTFIRLKQKEYDIWLQDFSNGELWSKDIIEGVPTYEQLSDLTRCS